MIFHIFQNNYSCILVDPECNVLCELGQNKINVLVETKKTVILTKKKMIRAHYFVGYGLLYKYKTVGEIFIKISSTHFFLNRGLISNVYNAQCILLYPSNIRVVGTL